MTVGADIQVLIAGGGVSGLSLAAFLEQAGVDPVVAERTEASATPPGTVVLWPDAVALLEGLGVGAALRANAAEVRTWTRQSADGTTAEHRTASGEEAFLSIEYRDLLDVLRAVVPAGTLNTGLGLRSLEERHESVVAEFANGVREQFDVVIGADGVRSRTRELVGGAEPTFYGTTSAPLPLADGLPLDGSAEVWLPEGTVVRALPNGDGHAVWVTVETRVPGQSPDPAALLSELSDAIDWVRVDATTSPASEELWWMDDLLVPAETWADGRVAFVGDAAHGRHRLTGVGTTLAVEDAAVLASELVDGDGPPGARLATYAARRQSTVDGQLRTTAGESARSGVDSPLAERYPSVHGTWDARLAGCFDGGTTTSPPVRFDGVSTGENTTDGSE